MILRSLPDVLLVLASLAAPASAQAGPGAAAGTDTSDVYETRHNHVLAFPSYVWSTLTWPLGKVTIWAERKGLFTVQGEEKTSGWSPYAALDGVGPGEETGTGGGITVFHSGFSARVIANRSNYGGKVLYEVPGIGDGSWYWNASVDALKTGSENATMNGPRPGRPRAGAPAGIPAAVRAARCGDRPRPPLQPRENRGLRAGCGPRVASGSRIPPT